MGRRKSRSENPLGLSSPATVERPLALRAVTPHLGLRTPGIVPMPEALRPVRMGEIRARRQTAPYLAQAVERHPRARSAPAKFEPLSGQARIDAARETLEGAIELIRRDGLRVSWDTEARGYSLHSAIWAAAAGDLGHIYARDVLRRILCRSLDEFSDAPTTRACDVVRVLRRALAQCTPRNRGGWRVSHGAPGVAK